MRLGSIDCMINKESIGSYFYVLTSGPKINDVVSGSVQSEAKWGQRKTRAILQQYHQVYLNYLGC
jgi:hypothetical protein